MKLLTIAGPLEQFEAVVRESIINQEFHPENALQLMEGVKGLRPFPLSNPYTALLRRAEEVAQRLGVALEYAPFGAGMETEGLGAYFDTLEGRIDELDAQEAEQERLGEEDRSIAAQLENLHGLSTDLDELFALTYARFRYGWLPRETYDSFRASMDEEEDIFFFPTNVGTKQVYGVYFTTKDAHKRVDSLMNSLHFTRIHIDAQPHGSADEAIADMNAQADAARERADGLKRELEELREGERQKLLSACAWLRYQNDAYDVRRYAAHSRETFYLMGWVPADELEALEGKLAAFENLSCVVDRAEDVGGLHPPTKLKNSFFGRIFRPFLEMYGLPAYNELDPSVFMALTYCLFFGIMFGDIGQGLCLALAGLVLARWKHMWLGNIITCCGLSGALFGCLYGSVFGNEELLGGFKVLEGNNVMTLLILSLSLGVVMLTFVMVLNVINGVRQKNFEKILFGPNGLAGMVFYLGLIGMALGAMTGAVNLMTPAYILPVLILPLVLMLLKEPLAKLLSGDPAWKQVRWGELVGLGFFELFETLLSYLTNSLSFLRVGAYAITHVGLMLVVQKLAGTGNIVVLVLGNVFVMGFEGLLVGIQVLRLEFYELFGRFYDDGGIPFVPKKIDYAARTNG